MFETHLTVVGRIVTDLRRKAGQRPGTDQLPVASNSAPQRRRHLGTRQLAVHHRQPLGQARHRRRGRAVQGRPVIVVGDVFPASTTTRTGARRWSCEPPPWARTCPAIVRFEQQPAGARRDMRRSPSPRTPRRERADATGVRGAGEPGPVGVTAPAAPGPRAAHPPEIN